MSEDSPQEGYKLLLVPVDSVEETAASRKAGEAYVAARHGGTGRTIMGPFEVVGDVGPDRKVVLVVPAGHEWLADANPLVPGCGFTLILGDYGMWRAEVRMASEVKGEVGMQLEITGRYPESAS